jgi:hypothetical protein
MPNPVVPPTTGPELPEPRTQAGSTTATVPGAVLQDLVQRAGSLLESVAQSGREQLAELRNAQNAPKIKTYEEWFYDYFNKHKGPLKKLLAGQTSVTEQYTATLHTLEKEAHAYAQVKMLEQEKTEAEHERALKVTQTYEQFLDNLDSLGRTWKAFDSSHLDHRHLEGAIIAGDIIAAAIDTITDYFDPKTQIIDPHVESAKAVVRVVEDPSWENIAVAGGAIAVSLISLASLLSFARAAAPARGRARGRSRSGHIGGGPSRGENVPENLDQPPTAPHEIRASVAPGASQWTRPGNWQGPASSRGRWLGEEGNSVFRLTDETADAFGVPRGTEVTFAEGVPDYSPFAMQTPAGSSGIFDVPGLTGVHGTDQRLIRRFLAEQAGISRADVDRYLRVNDLRMHHFRGTTVQLVPAKIHQLHHTGAAAALRGASQ